MHPLLESLNLDHPGLKAVREAAEMEDLSAALNAVVDYFRTREEPDPAGLAKPVEGAVPAAEKVLRHEYLFQNVPGTLPDGDFDWTYKPGTDWEWTWFLNRHHGWTPLASAYLATHDERYARELAMQIRTWVGNHPASTDDRASWRTIEAGIRTSGSWPAILSAMKQSEACTREVWLHYLRAIAEHAEFLIAHPKQNNWLLIETSGLLTCSLVFPEFKRAGEWLRIAEERFETEMRKQVHPDGAHIEYSTGYIFVAIGTFTAAADKADRVLGPGRAFSREYREQIAAMWEHVMYMMRPDGHQPMLNDADLRDVRGRLRAAGERYDRPDLIYAATNGAEGTPPADTSHRFPWVRRVVTRLGADGSDATAWAEDALYGFFEAAPAGAGHVNEDALTFEVMAYGQPLCGTMGRLTYERTPRRHFFCNGPGTNTVLVDGHPQWWKGTDPDRSSWVATGPTDLPWSSTPVQDTAYAAFDKPWADESLSGVVHERWFALRKATRPFWLVRDRLSGGDAVERELRTMFHLYPDAEIDPNDDGITVVRYPSGVGLVIAISDPGGMAFDAGKGEDDPVRGWFSHEYGQIEPVWQVDAVRRTVLPAQYCFVLVPFRGEAPQVSVEETPGGAAVTVDGDAVEVTL